MEVNTATNKLVLDGHKILWHRDRIEAWLRGERVAPITIDCALTRACSYNCIYCYGNLQENRGHTLTKDIIFRFLDDAAEIGVKAISFVSDGESTCSPHLYDAILRGKSNGLDMALGTNGFLLKDERLEEVLSSLTYLRFNISAGEPHRYAYIHGVTEKAFYKVKETILNATRIKREKRLDVTIGLQMVLMPENKGDVLPLADFGREVGVDYLVIKHCSDDENGALGINYSAYGELVDLLEKAEERSTENYLVKAKWSKILSGGKKKYTKCYAAPFMIQMSGSGLVAPCGFLFNDQYKDKFHIGNIAETSFKKLWQSERWWEVMDYITSDKFNAKLHCGTLCLQHKVNEFLWDLKNGRVSLPDRLEGEQPIHINFI
ncbi:MAG: radical SAM protein [Oligoflexales bacterium]|nr:radical SAM protein [Oligoflexales bacterium]